MDGIVHATFVDLKDEGSMHALSPDTSEFVTLEQQMLEQQPHFIIGCSETGSSVDGRESSPRESVHSKLYSFDSYLVKFLSVWRFF